MRKKPNRPKRVIAGTVRDVNDGWIENVDDFIQDLAQFYGYIVRKPGMPQGRKHKVRAYVILGPKGTDAGGTMMGKRGHKKYIEQLRKYYVENEGGPPEVKFEFKAFGKLGHG